MFAVSMSRGSYPLGAEIYGALSSSSPSSSQAFIKASHDFKDCNPESVQDACVMFDKHVCC